MAPPNGSAKPKPRRQGGNQRSGQQPKPAIPLPYMKKRQATAAPASSAAPVAAIASQPTNNGSHGDRKLANGSAKPQATPNAPASNPEPEPRPENGPETNNGAAQADQQDSSVASVSEHDLSSSAGDADDTTKASTTSDHLDQPTLPPHLDDISAQAPSSGYQTDATESIDGTTGRNHLNARRGELHSSRDTGAATTGAPNVVEQPHTKLSKMMRPPPPVSPSRYQMPPPFQPAARFAPMPANNELARGPRPPMPNGPPMHQPHLSNGSIHFGAFHGSGNSSPAPPMTGIAPPPGMQDARAPYVNHGATGYPAMMPYGGEMIHGANFDNYGRPSMPYGPVDSYPPFGANFGPGNPPSFQEGQHPAHADDNGMYPHYAGPGSNGPGPVEDAQSPIHGGRGFGGMEYGSLMHNNGPVPRGLGRNDEVEALLGHLQEQFGSPEFADCMLELCFSDDRARPFQIHGHRIILSRSKVLRALLSLAKKPTAMRTIRLETQSKWIRPDSFYMATQSLYGAPLLPIPPPMSNFKRGDVTNAGSAVERFDFALSYAAAGALLELPSVTRRGCEVVLPLLDVSVLDWPTVEKAVEFALQDVSDKGSYHEYKYGEGSQILLDGVLGFTLNNLPPNFTLDTSIKDDAPYSRLPTYPAAAASPVVEKDSGPVIAHSGSVQFSGGRRSQQITSIQFGDLSIHGGGAEDRVAKEAQKPRPASHGIISQILLNIPFPQLQQAVRQVTSAKVNGWTSAEYQLHVLQEVVAERERRRSQALDAVKAGRVKESESIKKQLSAPEPRYFDKWSALGWQEEFPQYGGLDGPGLVRSWVPLAASQNGAGAAASFP